MFLTFHNSLNKILTINIHQDPTRHVEAFLQSWLQFGAYEQVSELRFELIGASGKTSILSMTENKIIIDGNIPSETFMIIDTLAKACESDKVIEGEVIDRNQTQYQQNSQTFNNPFGNRAGATFHVPFGIGKFPKISALSKTKLILLLIIAIPLLIIMIPVIIMMTIVKIIMFKLNLK